MTNLPKDKGWVDFVHKYLFLIISFIACDVIYGQPSLTLSSGIAAAGGSVTLSVSLSSPPGSEPAALQWTTAYPASSMAPATALAGPSTTATGKTLSCSNSSGAYTCVVTGMNSTPISDGIVAYLTFALSSSAGSMPVGLTGLAGPTLLGSAQNVAATAGTILVSSGPPVSSIACGPSPVIGGSTSACTVTLSAVAPAGGATVLLSSSAGVASIPVGIL